MTTLTLQVEDDLLSRAEAAVRERGGDLHLELLSKLEELGGTNRVSVQRAAVDRMISWANTAPHSIEGPMPDREERNAR